MTASAKTGQPTKVADEVWLVTALLHREQPDRQDFTVREIRDRAEQEEIEGRLRPGVYVHIVLHCVANRAPNPGRYRMLFATGPKTRRLFREGDAYHRARAGSKTRPDRNDVPARYRALVDWYEQVYRQRSGDGVDDPILRLRGRGRELWKGLDPDDYVRGLREGWA
jgi:hypothetical protein